VWAAHLMFELSVSRFSATVRTGGGQWFAEAVATFVLLLTILGGLRSVPGAVAYAVGLYILLVHGLAALALSAWLWPRGEGRRAG
jgi:glycerol uptake facilitator-like aquaporin